MSRVIHFDINAHDAERASKFYSAVFGWSFNKWAGPMDYWLIKTGEDSEPGINGGLSVRPAEEPVKMINTISVTSLDEAIAKITQHGGTIVMPRMPVPGVGHLAYFQDTEGNTFGIMQFDPTAQG